MVPRYTLEHCPMDPLPSVPRGVVTNNSRQATHMKTHRRSAAALATAILLVGCAPGTQQNPAPSTPLSGEPTKSTQSTVPSAPVTTSPPTTQVPPTTPAPSAATAAPTAQQGSGGALQGSGQGLNGSGISRDVAVEDPAVVQSFTQYTEYVGQNLISIWNQWFQQRGIPPQDIAFVLVPKGTVYKTECHPPGGPPEPVTDQGSAFYCHIDKTVDGRTGIIWLPLTAMIGIVNGDVYGMGQSTWPGDFAFAETMGHEFGHHVQASLEEWYARNQPASGVKRPLGAWNELLADCFAGNWTQAIYTQGVLEEGDYMEAIAKIGLTGDAFSYGSDGSAIFDPSIDPHGAANHRVGAYKIGVEGVPEHNYQPGDPQTCMDYYWRADMNYTHDLVLPAG